MQRRVLGQEHPDTLSSASNLAAMLGSQEKYAEAERINLELLGVRRRVLGDEHPDTLTSANNLATALALQGKYAEAEEMGRAVLEARRRVRPSAHAGHSREPGVHSVKSRQGADQGADIFSSDSYRRIAAASLRRSRRRAAARRQARAQR